VGDVALTDERDCIREPQRSALARSEERRLFPGAQREQPLLRLPRLERVARVQADAVRAAVDERGTDANELAERRLELYGRVERCHRGMRGRRGSPGIHPLRRDDRVAHCCDRNPLRRGEYRSHGESATSRRATAAAYDWILAVATATTSPQLEPVETRNRIVRSGTSESASGPDGHVTETLVAIHDGLARGGVGLIFTGHMFCHSRGRYEHRQTGIDADDKIPGLRRLTAAVHRHGGKIFAQVAHAGSQSIVRDNEPLAPSPVANVMTGRRVRAANEEEIEEAIAAFAAGARRAAEAGFDGVHLHGANGYLISEFRSPLTNQRTDRWGGTQERRDAFPIAVVRAVRDALPPEL